MIQSVCEWAVVGPGAIVGPFAHLTAGDRIEASTQVPQAATVPGTGEGAR